MYRITCNREMTEPFTHWASIELAEKETIINIDDEHNVHISTTCKSTANRLFKAGNKVYYDVNEDGLPMYAECVNPTKITWSMIK